MNIKEKFEAIKKVIFADVIPTPADPMAMPMPPMAEPTKYTLKDGTVITIDKLEIGGMVMNGDVVAADGEYALEDGTSITVMAGSIVELMNPSQAAIEPLDASKQVAPITPAQSVDAMKKLQDNVTAMAAKVDELNSKFTKQIEANKQLFELVEMVANESKVAPVEQHKKYEDMTALEQFKARPRIK